MFRNHWIYRALSLVMFAASIFIGYVFYGYWPRIEALGIGDDPGSILFRLWTTAGVDREIVASNAFKTARLTAISLTAFGSFTAAMATACLAVSLDSEKMLIRLKVFLWLLLGATLTSPFFICLVMLPFLKTVWAPASIYEKAFGVITMAIGLVVMFLASLAVWGPIQRTLKTRV